MEAPQETILLTGATGVVGLAVAARLAAEGYRLKVLARKPALARGLLPAGTEMVAGSLQDVVALEEALQGCTACVHMAGLVSFANKDRDALLETNHRGTQTVVNACLAQPGLGHLVHIGSVAAIPQALADVRTVPRPGQFSSYYGYTKRLSELEVERGAAEGLGTTILRPSVVLGKHPAGRSSSAVLRIAERPTTACPPGQLHWVAVQDVAEAVAQALLKGPGGQTYVLDAEPTTWRTLFAAYRRQRGIEGRVYQLSKGMVAIAGRLSGMVGSLLDLPVPSKRQLLAMLEEKHYGGRAEATALLGRPFTSLEATVAGLV